jgi:hypothetical protein
VAEVPKKVKAATTLTQVGFDANAPLHPGRYCNAGCFGQLFNFGVGDLWQRLETERQRRETASLIVKPVSPKDTPLRNFRIYLNGYIRGTAPRDRNKAPRHSDYIELEPGNHLLVVRDYDHLDPHRRESNTVQFTIGAHQEITFSLALVDGQLRLCKGG